MTARFCLPLWQTTLGNVTPLHVTVSWSGQMSLILTGIMPKPTVFTLLTRIASATEP